MCCWLLQIFRVMPFSQRRPLALCGVGLGFSQAGCLFCQPTNSAKALNWKLKQNTATQYVVSAYKLTTSSKYNMIYFCSVTLLLLRNELSALTWGDPHIRTLDNVEYVFNGLAEYWMIESDSLELQARTVPAWDGQRQPTTNGTVLGAVAARALYLQSNRTTSSAHVHVEMPTDRTSSKI